MIQRLLALILFLSVAHVVHAATFTINQISVNDFRQTALFNKAAGIYTLTDNADYKTVFNTVDSVFTIFVNRDYKASSDAAVAELMGTHLKVEADKACWLSIHILAWGEDKGKYPIAEPSICKAHVSRRVRDKQTDINGDGKTNTIDYALILQRYDSKSDIKEDVNGDGIVNALDLSLVTTNLNTASN